MEAHTVPDLGRFAIGFDERDRARVHALWDEVFDSQRWSEGHAATTRTGDHPNAVIKRRSAHQLMRIDTLAVHAGPALPDRW